MKSTAQRSSFLMWGLLWGVFGLLIGGVVFIRVSGGQMGAFAGYIENAFPGFIAEESWIEELKRDPASHGYSIYEYLRTRRTDAAVDQAKAHLESSDPYIWLNAAIYLGSRGKHEAVPYLIKSIRHPAHKSLNERVSILTALTGENFGSDFKQWKEWYEKSSPYRSFDWESHLRMQ